MPAGTGPTITDLITFGFSFLALVISVYSLYLQYAAEGAKLDVLNSKGIQRVAFHRHSALPKAIQDRFPDRPDSEPGNAVIKIVFGNSGDRAGIVTLQDVRIKTIHSVYQVIKASYEPYTLVPAYGIVETEILLRNIPYGPNAIQVDLGIAIECGGYHPRTSKPLQIAGLYRTLTINLVPPSESPWTSIG